MVLTLEAQAEQKAVMQSNLYGCSLHKQKVISIFFQIGRPATGRLGRHLDECEARIEACILDT